MTGKDTEREVLLNIMENSPPGYETVIRKCSLDNLNWFIDRINLEIRKNEHLMEGPRPRDSDGYIKRWPTLETHREEIKWLEEVRGVVSEALHDKEVAARELAEKRQFRRDIGMLILAAVVSAVMALAVSVLYQYLSSIPSAIPPPK